MELEGALRAEPGGAALADRLALFDGMNTAVMTDMATTLRGVGNGARAPMGAIDSAVAELNGAWYGAAADAFVGYIGRFRTAVDGLRGAADEVAGALDAMVAELDGALSAIRGRAESFLAEARTLRRDAERDQTPPAAVDAQIRAIADDYLGSFERLVNQATTALSAASGAIGAHTGLGQVAGLGEPADAPFVPAPGRPVEWNPDAAPPPPPPPPPPAPPPAPPGSGPVAQPVFFDGGTGPVDTPSGGDGGGPGPGPSPSGEPDPGGGIGSSGGPPTSPPPGNVDQWIREAIRILQANGIPVTEDNIDEIWTIIQHESGGDPNAINEWDSNAARGTPSKGLMQTIDPTFDAYALPGHTDIWNPVDNIIAGVRYTFDRYGGFEGHPGLASLAAGGGYQGY